jgi:DNA mismatch repair protein MutL
VARVRLLDDSVINQIAAGEVVERPASVVKELLENSLDAEATRVRVEVAGGGLELLRVIDDGIGMTREDAELAVERHATSKIADATDLHTVSTLGFRGEALPSIASVSRFTLITQPRDAAVGTRIAIEGGANKEIVEAGAAPGTAIEVRELFFNVPARRKFLKTPQTEMSHITDIVVRLALARPRVGFTLVHEQRTVLDIPAEAESDPRGRLGRILGRAVAERLFPIPDDGKSYAISVRGFVSAPDLSERTARSLHVFVNGRYVRDRTVQHAIQDGYRTLLERGRHPVVVLWIEMDPAQVDVNVHPQKIEVRFQNTSDVHRAVSGALSRTLAAQPWLPSGTPAAPENVHRYVLRRDLASTSGLEEHRARVHDALSSFKRDVGSSPPSLVGWSPVAGAIAGFRSSPTPSTSEFPEPKQIDAQLTGGRFGSLEPVGQVMATYLVCQGPGRMVMIDQHAAHERIAFERMRKECANKTVARQPLLVPLSLELDAARASIAHDEKDRLAEIGFEMEHFGAGTWLVKSRPAAIGAANLRELVLDLLDELKDVGETTPMREVIDGLLSCAACHTVVRAGDRLTALEIKELLRQMDEIDFGAHCPHGRPVFVEWTQRELEALFHRS